MTYELLDHLASGASAVLAWDAWDNWHEHSPCCAVDHWGEIYQDTNGVYQPKKRYYSNEQVFKFVAPGMRHISTSTTNSHIVQLQAFSDDSMGRLTIVGQNAGASPQLLTVALTGVPTATSLAFYQTSATKNLNREADIPIVDGTFSATVDADSLFTLSTVGLAANTATPGPSTTAAPTNTPLPPTTPTATPSPGAASLVGDVAIEANRDSNPAGLAEAFQYTASTSSTANELRVYLDSANAASQVVVGLYTNVASNTPGSLLAQGTITSPLNGAWNAAAIPNTTITAGTSYWIALLGVAGAGTIQFRDAPAGGGKSQTSSQTTLSSLPATWLPGTTYASSPLSAYAAPAGAVTPSPSTTATIAATATLTATSTATVTATVTTLPPTRTPTALATSVATATATTTPRPASPTHTSPLTPTPYPPPNVSVQVAPEDGALQTRITARDAACAQGNNQLRALEFTRLTNATVDVTTVHTTPTVVPLPGHPASIQLTVHWVIGGQPTTVEMVVIDGCGNWPSFIGGGAGAF